MKKQKTTQELQLEEVQNALNYLVAEGIAEEVAPGQYQLTKEGKKLAKTTL